MVTAQTRNAIPITASSVPWRTKVLKSYTSRQTSLVIIPESAGHCLGLCEEKQEETYQELLQLNAIISSKVKECLSTAKSETELDSRNSKDIMEDLLLEFKSVEGKDRLAKFTVYPLEVHIHSDIGYTYCRQLAMASKNLILHIDATGSIVRDDKNFLLFW